MKKTNTNGSFALANLKIISLKLIAIIALVAVVGFSFTACKDGEETPVYKVIQISDIPKSVYTTGGLSYANNNSYADGVSLVPVGTAMTDPSAMSKVIAWGQTYGKDSNAISTNTTHWIWLYDPKNPSDRWTGTGTYDVYYAIADKYDDLNDLSKMKAVYKAGSVSFTIETTEVKWDKFTKQ